MNNKVVLVTGGAGFIGTNFVKFLLRNFRNISVLNLDKLNYAVNLKNLSDIGNNKHYHFIKGDICNRELMGYIFTEFKVDYVVNFAAESHVDRSIFNPNVFIETNVLGTSILLNVAREIWKKEEWAKKRFLQVSTDEVYGTLPENDKKKKFTEMTPLSPHSPYSASKAAADCIVKSYFDTFEFPILITRCSNNFGPFQFPEKLIPLMIINALNDKFLPIYGDGKNIRDWLYVDDHCEAIWQVILKGKPGEVYNIGGNNELLNIEIVHMILEYLNKPKSLIEYVKDRLGHDRRYAIDASKIKAELNWEPKRNFETMIKETIEWYISNINWVKDVTSGEYKRYYKRMYG